MGNQLRILSRLILFGLGLGLLAGTILKSKLARDIIIQSNHSNTQNSKPWSLSKWKNYEIKSNNSLELKSISSKWEELAKENPDLKVSGFMIFLDNGKYAKLSPSLALPAASAIKIPILLVTLKLIDEGKIDWDEYLTLNKDVIGGGAGWMAYKRIGSSFPVYEIATEMIRISDNTATNLLIKRIGGINQVNQYFRDFGLSSTNLKNPLPDLEGTNTSNTLDLTKALAIANSTNFLSVRSRDIFREVMSTSVTNRLLPGGLLKGLGVINGETDYELELKGFRVYNKTGDIGIAYADAGIIQAPNTKRAIAAFIVKGPFNDPRSAELIRNMASKISEVFKP